MRRVLVGLGVAAGGIAALVGGLVWDALLHADDPSLAAREGVLTLDNPGHLLLMAGIVLAGVGVLVAGDAALSLRAGGRWGPVGLRRSAIAVCGAVAVGAAGVAGWAGTQGHDHPAAAVQAERSHAHAHAQSHSQGGDDDEPTEAQRAAADRLRVDTVASTRRWPTVQAAEAAGYRPITPVFMGIQHWHNDRFHSDGKVLDPQAPEELIYASTRRGQVLVGAMYLMPRVGEKGPRIGGSLTAWHDHEDLCFAADGRVVGFHRPPVLTCPLGSANRPTPEMLHVWVVDTPDGPFAEEMTPAALADVVSGDG